MNIALTSPPRFFIAIHAQPARQLCAATGNDYASLSDPAAFLRLESTEMALGSRFPAVSLLQHGTDRHAVEDV
jgi:hypothetical protein